MSAIRREDEEDLWGYGKRLRFVRATIAESFSTRSPAEIQVLDVGCGNGSQLALPLVQSDLRVTGIDIDERSIARARSLAAGATNAHFLCGRVEGLSEEKLFDVVILSEVLEHTTEPQKLLAASVAHLELNGVLIITVPNGYGEFEIDSWVFRGLRLDRLVDALVRNNNELVGATDNLESGHVQFFTRKRLRRLFAECELVVTREGSGSFFGGPFAGYLLARSARFIEWNARITERLPFAWASSWYFALRRKPDKLPAFSGGSITAGESRNSQMKVVLLALGGDLAKVRARLADYYPPASIEIISRSELEKGTVAGRLRMLRARHADVFAIATERLAWQRGQNLLMLFGALAGAGEVLMIDAHGGLLRRSRASLLLGTPARLTKEAISSAMTFANARRELIRLEQEVEQTKPSAPELRDSRAKLRVIYLRSTPGPGTQAGGAASHIKGVVDALIDLGVKVSLISNDAIAGLDQSEAKITIIEAKSSGETRALFEIQNNMVFTRSALPLIARENPDFIYQRYARFGWVGVAAMLRTSRPLFLEYNGSEVWVGRHWDRIGRLHLLARFERLNLAGAARIFVVSEVERRNLESSGIAANKIIVNPNGVDTEVFRPGVGGVDVRRELGVDTDDVLVGFVSTFGPWHGALTLAEAIKTIPTKPSARFLLVGSGVLHGEVEQLLRSESETGRVIFTGAVEHSRVPALLDACDVLVAPHVPLTDGSEFFGSPTKLFEYMAMGKGIVASRLGQIGDVLSHEETALLVEPGNAGKLAEAIMRMVDSSELRERLGKKAREVAVQNHTWKQNAQRVLDAYRSLTEPTSKQD
jgi:glycosyltransferase involved in cell wall biosynthesis/SAM-dependent methyltransferase